MFSVLAISFGMLLIAAMDWQAPGGWFEFVVRRIATWSYGAYLWNNLIQRLMVNYFGSMPWWLNIILFLSATFFAAWFTFVTVERFGFFIRRLLLLRSP